MSPTEYEISIINGSVAIHVRSEQCGARNWLRYVIEHIQDWPANRVRVCGPEKLS